MFFCLSKVLGLTIETVPTQGWRAIARSAIHPTLQSGTEGSLLHYPPAFSPTQVPAVQPLLGMQTLGYILGPSGRKGLLFPHQRHHALNTDQMLFKTTRESAPLLSAVPEVTGSYRAQQGL